MRRELKRLQKIVDSLVGSEPAEEEKPSRRAVA